MGFVQIIEFRTSQPEELQALGDKWLAATEGKRTMVRELICADRDDPGHYVEVVEFDSYESAMKNSELPETQQIAEEMTKLCDGPMRFLNLDVVASH
ncbi:MAG: hypothetical protein M3357_07945 [Actinomycetota bacterium]|jgi:quinol monooxygenase YgiN|nr:hypothetical protein [Actinomycetota bacterium]